MIALLCDAYPFLTERYAALPDGDVDIGRLVRMHQLRDLYYTVRDAVRKPRREYVPGPPGRRMAGQWVDRWTDHEKTVVDRLQGLRRERDKARGE